MRSDSGWHRKTDNAASRERRRQYNSAEHKRLRAQAARQVAAGDAHCWRCGRWLAPDEPFHLGHDDHDRTIYRGTECVGCNLKAAAKKGAQVAHRHRRATRIARREWQPNGW